MGKSTLVFVGYGRMGRNVEQFLSNKTDVYHRTIISKSRDSESLKEELKSLDVGEKFLIIDFTNPSSVNENIEVYDSLNLDFICGSTGVSDKNHNKGDFKNIRLIDANMALPIVELFQIFKTFPPLHKSDVSLEITEEHQIGKKDPSGTALKVLGILSDKVSTKELNLDNYNSKVGGEIGPIRCIRKSEKLMSTHSYEFTLINTFDVSIFIEKINKLILKTKENPYIEITLTIDTEKTTEEINSLTIDVVITSHDIYADGVYNAVKFILNKPKHGTYSMSNIL